MDQQKTDQGVAQRIERVRERMAAAARRAGREPDAVMLVAVSKTQPAETVAAAYRAGLRLFGENRVEEAGLKTVAVARLVAPDPPPAWHMIGHLQSRKAADVLPWASMIHSVDSVKLATRLSRGLTSPPNPLSWQERGSTSPLPWQGGGAGGVGLPILLEVNIAGEESKYGFAPANLPTAVATIAALPGLRIAGLMTMAPIAPHPELARPVFAGLRQLRDDLARRFPALDLRHLSMGMTDDFEVAIEEGATLVRVGRAIFGERT